MRILKKVIPCIRALGLIKNAHTNTKIDYLSYRTDHSNKKHANQLHNALFGEKRLTQISAVF